MTTPSGDIERYIFSTSDGSVGCREGAARDVMKGSQEFGMLSMPEAYEMYMVPAIFDPWAEILLEAVGVRPGDRVLDVAAGTGAVTRRAAALAGDTGHVIAADISAAMLAQARDAMARSPGSFSFMECPAEALSVADRSQDVVTCQFGLAFFPDKLAAVRDMYRVLRRGGRVGMTVWAAEHPLGFFPPIRDALSLVAPEPSPGAFDLSGFAIHAEDLDGLLRSAGFHSVAVKTVSITAHWESLGGALAAIEGTFLGATITALPDEPRARALQHLAGSFMHAADGSVSCFTFGHVATGNRPPDGASGYGT